MTDSIERIEFSEPDDVSVEAVTLEDHEISDDSFVGIKPLDYARIRLREILDRPKVRSATLAAAGFAICTTGAVAGFFSTPPQEFEAGPIKADVTVTKTFSLTGGSNLDLNVLGGVNFPTHKGFGIEVRGTDIEGSNNPEQIADSLQQYDGTVDEFTEEIQDAVKTMTINSLLRTVGGIALMGGSLTAIMYTLSSNERFKHIARSTTAASLIGAGVIGGLPLLTYNEKAVDEATYYGLAAFLPNVVGDIETLSTNYPNNIRDTGEIVSYLTLLRNEAIDSEFIPKDAIGVLVVGDRHCMYGGIETENAIVESVPNIAVTLDNGDAVDAASAVENSVCFNGMTTKKIPRVSVAGNHDGPETMNAQREIGVLTPNYELVEAGGLMIYGVFDPTQTYTPDGSERVGADERPEDIARIRRDLISQSTDIFLTSHPAIAKSQMGYTDVVVAGDTHEMDAEIKEGTLYVNPGSITAGGARGLSNGQSLSRSAAIVYFLDGKPIALTKLDLGKQGEVQLKLEHCELDFENDKINC